MKTSSRALLFSLPLAAFFVGAQPLRAAAPSEDKPFTKEEALAYAERFVALQGYTSQPNQVSQGGMVEDPLDTGPDSAAKLRARFATLEPKAVGARFDSDLWFVGFRSRSGGRLRSLRMGPKGEAVKMVSQSIQPDWLAGNDPVPTAITKDEAAAIAKRFVEAHGPKGLAKEPAKVVEHKPDAKDGWDSWWAYFPKQGAKLAVEPKAGEYALVSVHKLSREPKWAVELKAKPAPAPKPARKAAPSKKADPKKR
ncbi:MAG: hypothetical protein HY924_12210 [Elusimicrobia bacterium]|nr:hypothetical protein [Elusimicrobiota bacterium]